VLVHEISIDPGGTLRFIWADELADLVELGASEIHRASHVEPAAAGGWTADLGPVGGPALGPFRLRGDALRAERDWLGRHIATLILPPTSPASRSRVSRSSRIGERCCLPASVRVAARRASSSNGVKIRIRQRAAPGLDVMAGADNIGRGDLAAAPDFWRNGR
jgi:hypothetical protein